MNEATEVNPSVEAAEQRALGTTTYQKAEVVHRFADMHPWFHPLLALGSIITIICVVLFIVRMFRKKTESVTDAIKPVAEKL